MMKRLHTFTLAALMAGSACLAQEAAPAQDATAAAITRSNETGIKLLQQLSKQGGKNMAVSPVSVNGMFGLLQPGAAGTTLEQMNTVLGDTAQLQQFTRQFASPDKGTTISNMLVVDNALTLAPDYLNSVPADEVRQADFKADPEKQRVDINSWVASKTGDEIKELLPSGSLTAQTRLVALNATLFEGKWARQFKQEATRDEAFHAKDGDVSTPMMSDTGNYRFSIDDGHSTLVSLPYASGEEGKAGTMSLIIIMPAEGVALHDFIMEQTWADLDKQINAVSGEREIRLQLPKFEIKTPTLPLSSPLKQLGLTDIFDGQKADLTKLSAEKGLYLDEVYHQCYVKVDEQGTKAAAATAGIIAKMSLPLPIVINRPFLWLIYDSETKLVLFCGTVDNPKPAQD